MFKDEGRDSLIIIFIMIKMVLVSPCSTTGAGRGALRADWNEEEAPGQDMVMVMFIIMVMFIMVMVMVMFIMVMFTVEVWIFLEENEISCERHWQ